MRALVKFAHLSHAEKVLVFRATLALLSGLYTVKFGSYRNLRKRISAAPLIASERATDVSMQRILEVIGAISRRLPGTACLSNAIAARETLARYGYACTLRIGVTLEDAGRFLAHAWLEVDGKSVFGGTDSSSRYAALELGPANTPSIK
jgi:hypothetical protein